MNILIQIWDISPKMFVGKGSGFKLHSSSSTPLFSCFYLIRLYRSHYQAVERKYFWVTPSSPLS